MKPQPPGKKSSGPRKRLSAETRRQLSIERASRLFATKGFNGVTTQELANACGVSEAMLYKIFGDKQGLYKAILEWKISGPGQDLIRSKEASLEDDHGVFSALMEQAIIHTRDDDSFLRLLLFSALEGNELSPMFHQSYMQDLLGFLATYIKRRIGTGHFRKVEPRMAALAIISMVAQYLYLTVIFDVKEFQSMSPSKVANAFVDIALNGLAKPARKASKAKPSARRSRGS